jgi:hypothetical protein
MAALRENDLGNRRSSMPFLPTTRGGTIAGACSRCRSRRNYEFAIDTKPEAQVGRRAARKKTESKA